MPRRKSAATGAGQAKKARSDAAAASTAVVSEGESSNVREEANISLPAEEGPQPLLSVCDSLGLHLSVAVKDKIQKGEFVNLGALILPPGSSPSSISFAIARQGDNIVLGPQTAKPPTVDSIEEWTSAFMVYMSVYLEVHGSRAIEMLKYMDIIRGAAQQFGGKNWIIYDEQFRIKQARYPTKSWATIDSELWLRVLAVPNPHSFRPSRSQFEIGSQRQFRPTSLNRSGFSQQQGRTATVGMCFAYNRNGFCNRQNCQFAHKCSQCKKSGHPFITCQQVKDRIAKSGPTKPFAKRSTNPN